MLDGCTSIRPTLKDFTPKLPISRTTLQIVATGGTTKPEINGDAAFNLCFNACLRMGEVAYTDKQRAEPSFTSTKATRSDIHISPNRDHLTFRLKRSKTDKDKQGVQIIVAAIYDAVCPVTAMQRLFLCDP